MLHEIFFMDLRAEDLAKSVCYSEHGLGSMQFEALYTVDGISIKNRCRIKHPKLSDIPVALHTTHYPCFPPSSASTRHAGMSG
jgi:hypothetical protein